MARTTITSPDNRSLTGGTDSVFFAVRYNWLSITNNDTEPMYGRTDGMASSSTGGEGDYEIPPGETALVPNSAPLWYQGQADNPGTKLDLASATATAGYNVVGVA